MLARIGMALLLGIGASDASSHGAPKSPQTGEPGSSLHFRLRDRYLVIVPVSVNGLKPVDFILDSGSRTTMIDERIGRKLGLQVVARMPLTTFTGTVMSHISRVDSIAMGTAKASGVEVGCVDLHRAYSLDPDIHGILASDFLSRFNYLLDYRAQRVRIEEDADLVAAVAGPHLPVEQRGFRDHVHFDSGSQSEPEIHFMLDSGAPLLVVFEDARVNSCLKVARENRGVSIVNSIGSRSFDMGRLNVLRIGGETIRSLAVRVTKPRESEHRWENGLLPTSLFSAVYFNHGEGYVVLNPRLSH